MKFEKKSKISRYTVHARVLLEMQWNCWQCTCWGRRWLAWCCWEIIWWNQLICYVQNLGLWGIPNMQRTWYSYLNALTSPLASLYRTLLWLLGLYSADKMIWTYTNTTFVAHFAESSVVCAVTEVVISTDRCTDSQYYNQLLQYLALNASFGIVIGNFC